MRALILYIILLSSSSLLGQEIIDRIDPSIILDQKIISCTEWRGEEKDRTVYFNSKGLPHYFRFSADVLDTNSNLISGDFGKREFIYDENGNLIESIMSYYEPTLDSSIVMTFIKNYYSKNLIIKREYFDSPSAKSKVITYHYNDTLLTKEIKTKPDSSPIANTGEKFKAESTEYKYNNANKLVSILNFREANLLDSTSVNYHNDTTTWTSFNSQNRETSVVKIIYDIFDREIKRIYPGSKIIKWKYKENGLLESIEYKYLETGEIRRTKFTYEKYNGL